MVFFVLSILSAPAFWITGYYPQYESAVMSPANIDFSTVTHVIHFSLQPNANATISINGLTPPACSNLVNAAHAAARKALVCVGGAGSETAFQGATTTPAKISAFAANIASFMSTNHYDGVDIDWEPLAVSDIPQYTNFVLALRAAIDAQGSDKLLTAAAPAYPNYGDSSAAYYNLFASVQSQFDQINVMTYDLSGPYEGWVTWFNSPLTNAGYTFPSTGGPVPSDNAAIANFISAGVAPAKLALGLPFYGYLWTGGPGLTQPRQSWSDSDPPTVTTATYVDIITRYYQFNRYHWDNAAQAAYLSVTNSPAADDLFISFDDATSCQVKISDARNLHLGGLMIWELSQDWSGAQSPLLTALHQALATPQILSAGLQSGHFFLTFSSLPLASYQVQWASSPAGPWNVLSNNIPGSGAPLQISDPSGLAASNRFYRVLTPP